MTILANAYCTVAELLIHIESTTDTSTALTNRAELAIQSASRLIDRLTGRFFYTKVLDGEKLDVYGPSASGVYLNGDRRNKIELPAPIINVTTLTEDDESLTEDTDFYVYNPSGFGDSYILKDNNGLWTYSQKAIVISATIGYATTPYEIRNICLEMAAIIMRAKESFITDSEGNILGQLESKLPSSTYSTLRMLKRKFIV